MKNLKIADYFKDNKDVRYNHEVTGITTDSNLVKKGNIFVALKGSKHNGNDYINDLMNLQVKTIVTDDYDIYLKYRFMKKVNVIFQELASKTLARLAKIYYDDISKKLNIIGITGTNGKTTTATLVYKYFRYLGKNIAMIGSNGIYINDEHFETTNTTPNILTIYKYLQLALEKDCLVVVMEVSSEGYKENRVKGITFKLGLLTNITCEHLNYHKTFEDYFYTKLLFLKDCEKVILNKDIPYFMDCYRNIDVPIYTYGKNNADYCFGDPHIDVQETTFDLSINNSTDKFFIVSSLLGEFNIYNVLAFIAIIDTLEMFDSHLLSFLKKRIIVPGRLEIVKSPKSIIVIDFAHTPDGVSKVLNFLNSVKTNKLITVIGMGGERDTTKRPIVGDICTSLSDCTIFTEDNNRFECFSSIIDDITDGVQEKNNFRYIIEKDRVKAIELAYKMSRNNDIIAILGKGNEKYILNKGEYIPYNDKEEVYKIIGKINEHDI